MKKIISFLLICLMIVPSAFASHDPSASRNKLLGRIVGANMNVTTDQAIIMGSSNYVIRRIVVKNASTSLTTAVGGFYTATSKGGTVLVANTQTYIALSAAAKYLDLTLAAAPTTDLQTATTIYLSLTTPQGGAATADVYVFGDDLS